MRVHIISDVYPPEPVTAAGIARDIAEEMTRRSHETQVQEVVASGSVLGSSHRTDKGSEII